MQSMVNVLYKLNARELDRKASCLRSVAFHRVGAMDIHCTPNCKGFQDVCSDRNILHPIAVPMSVEKKTYLTVQT